MDTDLALRYLTPAQMTLFQQMSRSTQLHSLNVLRDVLAQDDPVPHDLAVAALLHDCGKARYHAAVWQKTLVVLMEAFLPGLALRLSADETRLDWLRAPFVLRRYHPGWSATALTTLNAPETVIWLAAHHADSPDHWRDHPAYHLLIRLRLADDAN